jgi:hypothetical protein
MRDGDGCSRECSLLNGHLQNCKWPGKPLVLISEGVG